MTAISSIIRYQFHWTDAGRSQSRRPRQKNDCTVRAVALACGIEYDTAYDVLAEAGRKCGRGFHFGEWAKSASVNGHRFHWRSFPAVKGQRRMNPSTFSGAFPSGRWIVRTAKHVFAVIDGVYMDIACPDADRCIYGAWEVTRGLLPGVRRGRGGITAAPHACFAPSPVAFSTSTMPS